MDDGQQRLQKLKELKRVYEMSLNDLSEREATGEIIDKMLEMLYKVLQEIKTLENNIKQMN